MMPVDLVIVAWPKTPARLAYLDFTLRSFRHYLDPRCVCRWLCSAELQGVPAGLQGGFEAVCCHHRFEILRHPGVPQLGRHMNWLMTQLNGLFFCGQDDIVLTEPLDLSPAVALIQSGAGQYVRYFVNDKPTLVEDPAYPGFLRPTGDWAYPFGNPQYLADTDFFTKLGPWQERGGQEKHMTEQVRAAGLPVWVAAQKPFVHIGEESAMGHHCAATPVSQIGGSHEAT